MQVIANDLVISYSKVGSGPVAVLLHGWADSKATFDLLTQQLQQNYTVITLDLAGFGGSQPPAKGWGLTDFAQHVAVVLQKIAIMPNDVNLLIGHSNGGAVAVRAIAKGYLKPKKLVLIASAGIRETSAKKAALQGATKVAKIASYILPKSARKKMRSKLYGQVGSDYLVAEHMQDSFKRIVKDDIQHDAERITIPTCIIYGELDTATPVRYAQLLNSLIAGSQLHVIQNADHFVHQQYALEVFNYIRRFDKS